MLILFLFGHGSGGIAYGSASDIGSGQKYASQGSSEVASGLRGMMGGEGFCRAFMSGVSLISGSAGSCEGVRGKGSDRLIVSPAQSRLP